MKKLTYEHTICTCFLGYVVQAAIVNFAPLLFVMFQEDFGMNLARVTSLVTLNFAIQLFLDLCSTLIVKRFGYRKTAVLAQAFSVAGFVCLAFLPYLFEDAYTGLLIATAIYAVGGGLDEVVISPIVELCPTKRKAASMSLLHSFYCWGLLFTVLLSTAYFALFGLQNYRWLALFWAVLPLIAMISFLFVPIPKGEQTEKTGGVLRLFRNKKFLLLALVMVCSGAAEQSIAQWASAFAQTGLSVSKAVGDLTGPCLFALLMGTARVAYAKWSEHISAGKAMLLSGFLCVSGYLLASLAPVPALGLAGCALSGFAVGIFWPCTLSMGAGNIRDGGIALFAMLALFGDIGCTFGPTLVGVVSDAAGDSLGKGILVATLFPLLLIIGILLFMRERKKEKQKE